MSLLVPVDRESDPEVQHTPSTLEQNEVGVADTSPEITKDIVSRDINSHQTSSPQSNEVVGSCIKIITDVGSGISKDDSSSVGELFRHRKRHLPNVDANDPTTPPIEMCRETLHQVEDDFPVLDEKGPSVDTELTKKIENVFFESSGENTKL